MNELLLKYFIIRNIKVSKCLKLGMMLLLSQQGQHVGQSSDINFFF